jgi:large subunit ribosomal protein L47
MARIKAVMNERRIAYEGAVKIFAEHKEEAQDIQLMKLHRGVVAQAEQKLAEFQTRGRAIRREQAKKYAQAKKELKAQGVLPPAADATTEAASVPEAESSTPAAENPVEASPTPTPSPSEPSKEAKKEIPTGSDPKSALDTAAAGLFGESVTSKKD